jgi:hypothetical protein
MFIDYKTLILFYKNDSRYYKEFDFNQILFIE